MAGSKPEAAKPEAERNGKGGEGAPSEAAAVAGAAAGGGGIKGWLPLIIAIAVLPVVAYVVTSFVLLPKLQQGLGLGPAAAAGHEAKKEGGHEAKKEGGHEAKKEGGEGGGHEAKKEGGGGSAGGKDQVPLTKLVVNVAGTSASRILLSSVMLVGSVPEFHALVKDHEPQLRDIACGILSTKTIQELERPGARNIIRSELLTAFNNVLGGSSVQEIYFTDFAVQ